jgi:hypothetical protein
VVEFPGEASNFTAEMAAELLALVNAGTIHGLDIMNLTKDEDGAVEAVEVGELGELQALEAEMAERSRGRDTGTAGSPPPDLIPDSWTC